MLYKAFIRRTLENQPNLTLFQQECGDLIVENGSGPWRGHRHRHRIPRARRGAHRRHVPRRPHSRRPRQLQPAAAPAIRRLTSLPSACARCRSAPARLKTGTPPRIDGRTIDYSQLADAVFRRAAPGVQLSRPRERSSRAAALPHHGDHGTHARDHPRRDRSLADVHRQDRRRGPSLLPERRRQGSSVRGQDFAPDLHRARRPEHARGVSERHLDQPAV